MSASRASVVRSSRAVSMPLMVSNKRSIRKEKLNPRGRCPSDYPSRVEFRRINALPPYVFTIIEGLKMAARRAGEDVIDLGFGNPDIPSPDVAVDKLAEAARNPRNHRYSSSRGIPKLRLAVSNLYLRRFGVELDPETDAIITIGAKD